MLTGEGVMVRNHVHIVKGRNSPAFPNKRVARNIRRLIHHNLRKKNAVVVPQKDDVVTGLHHSSTAVLVVSKPAEIANHYN